MGFGRAEAARPNPSLIFLFSPRVNEFVDTGREGGRGLRGEISQHGQVEKRAGALSRLMPMGQSAALPLAPTMGEGVLTVRLSSPKSQPGRQETCDWGKGCRAPRRGRDAGFNKKRR